jgi:t-SNARE complex subunit (syntaxin)
MSRDRTAEFFALSGKQLPIQNNTSDEDLTITEKSDKDADIYDDIDIIKNGIKTFEEKLNKLEELIDKVVGLGNRTKYTETYITANKECTELATILRKRMYDLKDKETRMTHNIIITLASKIITLLRRYERIQADFNIQVQNQVDRQNDIVDDESKSAICFQDHILESKRDITEKTAMINIEEQHRDIIRLEQSLIELHQIMIDMATLIAIQDEQIDQIEWNCDQAKEWTGEAVKEITDADRFVKKRRKRCCMCGMCTGCVGCAACASIGGYLALSLAPLAVCSIM